MATKILTTEIPYESKTSIYFCKGNDEGKLEVWQAQRGRKKKVVEPLLEKVEKIEPPKPEPVATELPKEGPKKEEPKPPIEEESIPF